MDRKSQLSCCWALLRLSSTHLSCSAFGPELPEDPESVDCPLRDGVELIFSYDVGRPTNFAVDVYFHTVPEVADISAYPVVTKSDGRKRKLSLWAAEKSARTAPKLMPVEEAKGVADEAFPNLAEAVLSRRFDAFYIGSQCAGMYGTVQGPDGDVLTTPVQFAYLQDWLAAFEAAWPHWKRANDCGTRAKMHVFPAYAENDHVGAGRWYDNELKAYDKVREQVEKHRNDPSSRRNGPQFLMHEMTPEELQASRSEESRKSFEQTYPELYRSLHYHQKSRYEYLTIREGRVVVSRGAMKDKNGRRLPASAKIQESIAGCRSLHEIFTVADNALKRLFEML